MDAKAQEYDIVMLLGGLHHVPTQAGQIVGKLASGLNKGGIFINYEPTHGNPMTRWACERIYDKITLFDEQTERGFSVVELLEFFQTCELRTGAHIVPGFVVICPLLQSGCVFFA